MSQVRQLLCSRRTRQSSPPLLLHLRERFRRKVPLVVTQAHREQHQRQLQRQHQQQRLFLFLLPQWSLTQATIKQRTWQATMHWAHRVLLFLQKHHSRATLHVL
jgi:hypothetical protein